MSHKKKRKEWADELIKAMEAEGWTADMEEDKEYCPSHADQGSDNIEDASTLRGQRNDLIDGDRDDIILRCDDEDCDVRRQWYVPEFDDE